VSKQPDPSTALARRFCFALAEETAGLEPGAWRMVDTIAQRMGVTVEEGGYS
jgi:hypothetical protein